MKRLAIAAMLMMVGLAGVATAQEAMSDDQLRAFFVGNTTVNKFTVPNGSRTLTTKTFYAPDGKIYAYNEFTKMDGAWTIADSKFCTTWNTDKPQWAPRCWVPPFERSGDEYLRGNTDGSKTPFTVEAGDPYGAKAKFD